MPAAPTALRADNVWLHRGYLGSILGFLVWDEIPTVPIIIGAAIVTLTGLYLLRQEALHRTSSRPAQAALSPR